MPAGQAPAHDGQIHDWQTVLYRARTYDCGPCPLKSKCCPKAPERKIPRSIYEGARDAARALADTEAFKQSRHDRKRVEMLFAHLKRILKLGRLRLRGPRGAQASSRSQLSHRTYAGSPNWSPDHHQPPPGALRNRCGRQCHCLQWSGWQRMTPRRASVVSLL